MEWISIKEKVPSSGTKVRIKAHYDEDGIVEADAIFTIYDIDGETEAWGWKMSEEESKVYGTLRPTHWMPLAD